MKFYNRQKELELLRRIEQNSLQNAQMTFVVGRRRIGKTSLLAKATERSKSLYFFVAKKSEPLLCAEFSNEIKRKLNVPIFGELKSFRDLFGFFDGSIQDTTFHFGHRRVSRVLFNK